jgi:hypothetical protein
MSMRRIEEIFARHREEYVIRRIEEISTSKIKQSA